MEPAAVGIKLASGAVAPLVKRLFRAEGPGAELVDKPVRLAALVSFKGEKRTLGEGDLRTLAGALVGRALRGGERPFPAEEEQAVVQALAATLYGLGELDLDDVQAVGLGHEALARRLQQTAGRQARRGLSRDAAYFLDALLDSACLHILHFFSQRSAFVKRTLVEQTRRQAELVAKVDALIARTPLPEARDAAFERLWLEHVARKHGKLTIYGIDLANSPGKWPLDAAYMRLEAASAGPVRAPEPEGLGLEGNDGLEGPAVLPADQALAGHEEVLLRGVAGSGKTTLVQWLAVSAARTDLGEATGYLRGRIPFVLPVRTLTRHGQRLPAPRDFLAATGSPLAGSQPDGWEHRVLAAGRGLLLVDGIDEIPVPERARVRTWLADLIDAYPGNRWLVTSRPSAVDENWLADEGFAELTLAPMNPAWVDAFVRRWHTAARTGGEEDARLATYEGQLLAAVREKPELGRLATNPLMCGLMCALNRDRRGYLPRGRKELYEAALSMLLTRRDRERDIAGPEIREEPQLQVLQRLAYWLIRNGRTEMDRGRAESIVAGVLPSVPEVAGLGDAAAVYEHFLDRSGLLREPVPGAVDFVHRTFQDFLGARAAVEDGDFGVLAEHAGDDQWDDVIRMAVAQARPRERQQLLGELLTAAAAQEGVEGVRIRLLATACLEHAAELAPEVRQAVERQAERLIPPGTAVEARALGAAGPIVLELLPGPEQVDEDTAVHVVTAATYVESERAPAFLARYARHPSLKVRGQLVWAWHRHDTDAYAQEVIARLDPAELIFTVNSDDELRALRTLGTRPTLEARGTLSVQELAEYAAAAQQLTTVIVQHNPLLHDLEFLRGRAAALEHVRLSRCGNLTDATALAGLPLRGLVLDKVPRLRDIRGLLAALPGLRHLSLSADREAGLDLAELPSLPELTTLNLLTARVSELRGLSRYAGVQTLQLGWRSSPGTAGAWEELGSMAELRTLTLATDSLDVAPAGACLPAVRDLTLVGLPRLRLRTAPADGLADVPRLFPGLVRLRLVADWNTDLTPLTGLTELRELFLPFSAGGTRGRSWHGAERLSHVRLVFGDADRGRPDPDRP